MHLTAASPEDDHFCHLFCPQLGHAHSEKIMSFW